MVWEFWLHWYNCYLNKWLEISFCSELTYLDLDGTRCMSLEREFQKEKQVCNGERQEMIWQSTHRHQQVCFGKLAGVCECFVRVFLPAWCLSKRWFKSRQTNCSRITKSETSDRFLATTLESHCSGDKEYQVHWRLSTRKRLVQSVDVPKVLALSSTREAN